MRGIVATIRQPAMQDRLQRWGLIVAGIDLALALDALALWMIGA